MCDTMTKEKELQIQQPLQVEQREAVQQEQLAQPLQQELQLQAVQPLVQHMEVHAQIDAPAPPLQQKESRTERKKREQLENARQKAAEQREVVRRQEEAVNLQPVEAQERIKAEQALHIGVYREDKEDTQYYAPYRAEGI